MKRILLFMFTLVLFVVVATQAMAVDVKFSGEYYAAGMYLDKTNFKKDSGADGISTAFYFQRLRVRTDYIVSPGLSLTTRFDAMKRAWGAARSIPGSELDPQSSGTTAENENIAFDLAYLSYTSPIGILRVGYLPEGTWGTVFANSTGTLGKVQFAVPFGSFQVSAYFGKTADLSRTAKNPTIATDQDFDKYVLNGRYRTKDFEAGLLYQYRRMASDKVVGVMFGAPNPMVLTGHGLNPYLRAKFGPVAVEAELQYAFGNIKWEDGGTGPWGAGDISVSNIAAYADAVVNLDMVYFGGTFAYVSGDDPATKDKMEGGILDGGEDFQPCLLMFNYDRSYWVGDLTGHANSKNGSPMTNAWFGQGRVGVRPVGKLDILASLSYAQADKKPTNYISRTYGWEADLTATYKITDNLSYMLGFGYLFTGDYFKANSDSNKLNNDYLVINKLTLTF